MTDIVLCEHQRCLLREDTEPGLQEHCPLFSPHHRPSTTFLHMKDITQLTAYLREKKEKTRIVAAALWTDFMNKRVMESASQLTYSTLLATVPVVAVIFAIARGFGYNKYIESWFRS